MHRLKMLRVCLLLLSCGFTAASLSRHEFVSKMDEAVRERQREDRISSRLMEMARPVDESPRFLEQNYDFAINITEYALRYIGCQNVHQYSDDLAQDEDAEGVLGMNRFVIVRLCPKDECSNYHHYGCNHGYGDYLIPMEDYLMTMAEEYFLEYQTYCETCYACQQRQNYNFNAYNNNAMGDDGANAAADDGVNAAADDAVAAGDDQANANDDDGMNAAGDDANNGGRRLANDDGYYYMGADFYNDGDQNADNQDMCSLYASACADYKSACKDYSQYATDMENYFQCAAFQIGDYSGYLGPHCRSDGKTIGIGLYKDENCNEYNSDFIDISSMLGMELSDDNLKAYYSDQCISCDASEGFDLNQQYSGEEVTAVCGALYDMSAKCNRYMGYEGEYASENQEKNEETVCTFIHNLITNSYDEYGHIYLTNDWKSYIPDVRTMSLFQKWAMSLSVLSVVGLFGYALYLHRILSGAKFTWHPNKKKRRGGYGFPGQSSNMERVHSGIIQGRSRSELHDGAVFA